MPLFEKPDTPVSKAQKRYAAFVESNGELFEKKVVPMDAEDLKNVEYNYRFTKRITIPVTLGITLIALGTITWFGMDWYKTLSGVIMLMVLGGFLMSLVSHYRGLLEKKEKTIVKGVVTQKRSFSRGSYYVFLSEQEEIEVTQEEFKRCVGGEIVEVSFLSKERPLRRSFRIIDQLP